MAKHDEAKLPQWAQRRLELARHERREAHCELRRIRMASAVLDRAGWFTLKGPDFKSGENSRKLFYLERDGVVCACDLGPGDILLVGRAEKADV